MKIAIICSSFFPVIDGVTIAVFNRLQQLSLLGHQVQIFCPDYSVISHIYPNWQDYIGEVFPGVQVINLPSTASIGLDFERDVTSKSYNIVVNELEKFQPDIIHVDEAERLGICFFKLTGVKFAKQHNIPCVAWFHTNYLDYFDDYFNLPLGINKLIKSTLSLIFARIYNSYDLTLVSSSVTAKKLSEIGIKNLCCAELLGCDLSRFTNQEKTPNFFSEKYKLSNNIESKIKLIFLGRLTPDKGWDFALRSLTNLPSEVLEQIAIIIAGDGPMKEQIEESLKQITTNVYLLGRIAPESVPALITNSDIFVTTSEKETRGLTIIEAAAAGIPAIAPATGGVIDTIQDGQTGFLYEPQSEKDFLEKLTLLICDRDLRRLMGANAQEIAKQWSWQQTVDNLVEIWSQEIVENNR
ncbi:glycosyltransferase [Xenococcus sp. PCC 7305]|uniref:glycosyltransferase n=1 Tax=Xenococcus sp. PCC 7305 TaxID=102125 RepID=UPI0002AC1E10|nr:glycosyltransferase [Xenococcus sp. PCC 7305]ELS00396.1 glycosyltransferase [Xenococcus sp. PCC 7305]